MTWFLSQFGAVDLVGMAVALLGGGFSLGMWVAHLVDRPVIVLMIQALRDVQRAEKHGVELPDSVSSGIRALIGRLEDAP